MKRSATRMLHIQREVDGRTHQVNLLSRFDHATKEYVLSEAQRASIDLGIAAQVVREPPSAARLAFVRSALGATIAGLAAQLGVDEGDVSSWERGDKPLPEGAWHALADAVERLRNARGDANASEL